MDETNLFYYIINCSFYNRNNNYKFRNYFCTRKKIEINNLITSEIDESMETNNTLSQMANNTFLIE